MITDNYLQYLLDSSEIDEMDMGEYGFALDILMNNGFRFAVFGCNRQVAYMEAKFKITQLEKYLGLYKKKNNIVPGTEIYEQLSFDIDG